MTRRPAAGPVFLLEIGTEEIPGRMMDDALEQLRAGLHQAIIDARLAPEARFTPAENIEVFGTPRRLAARVSGLMARQPDESLEITGPPARVAFDGDGKPTRAAEGFARAQGVRTSGLVRMMTPRGECVGVRKMVKGLPAARILGRVVPTVVGAMTFPKTMKWGTGEHRFVRPIHSVVALLDERTVPMVIAGVRSGRMTFGHVATGGRRVSLKNPGHYLDALRRVGVLADVHERRRMVEGQLKRACVAVGGRIATPPGSGVPAPDGGDPELLNEVVQMVEWPTVITGRFDEGFLDLPGEILMTAMRHHQRYFSLTDARGALMNRFLAVANSTRDERGAIRRGNEWVLRARLADSRFFWEEDRKKSLAEHGAGLDRVTFHEKLGSYSMKVSRMDRLVEAIGQSFRDAGHEVDIIAAKKAVGLCKNDLTTQMVNEFPELQGTVGAIYARADGEPERIAKAIGSHYLPTGPDSPLPGTAEGRIVAIADRLDTQAGIFLLGMIPTGSRDPYGLRRSVLGVSRILIEGRVRASLAGLLERALHGYENMTIDGSVGAARAVDTLLGFYRARLEYLGEEAGCRQDSARAALSADSDDPFTARLRMLALDAIRSESDFEALALAHKRIKNILKSQPSHRLDSARLSQAAERALHSELESVRPILKETISRCEYVKALKSIARLRPALDRFFDEVMVMDKDREIRENRLALLQSIAALFLEIGDFSEVAVAGEQSGVAPAGARV